MLILSKMRKSKKKYTKCILQTNLKLAKNTRNKKKKSSTNQLVPIQQKQIIMMPIYYYVSQEKPRMPNTCMTATGLCLLMSIIIQKTRIMNVPFPNDIIGIIINMLDNKYYCSKPINDNKKVSPGDENEYTKYNDEADYDFGYTEDDYYFDLDCDQPKEKYIMVDDDYICDTQSDHLRGFASAYHMANDFWSDDSDNDY